MTTEIQREMPRYKSHKTVWALKIAQITPDEPLTGIGGNTMPATITPAEGGYAPFRVDVHFMAKHQPVVGGYYVVYADGYKSFSPAKAFEEGNTLEL